MLTVGVLNLGPLRQAEVTLEPLTVFVGPNNSGKSFLATIIYAILSAASSPPEEVNLFPSWRYMQFPHLEPAESAAITALLELDEQFTASNVHPRAGKVLDRWLNEVLHEYGQLVIYSIAKAFGSSVTELRRAHGSVKSARVVISDSDLDWRVTISFGAKSTRTYIKTGNPIHVLQRLDAATLRRVKTRSASRRNEVALLRSSLATVLLSGLSPTLYLPAARSGLMQSQRAIAGAIVQRASLAGIEDVRVPALSGVVADFLSRLLTLPRYRQGPFSKEADRLEQQVLHGHIAIQNTNSTAPEIVYRTGDSEFPIHRTSSMISELAPVVLLIRMALYPGHILIIEEPESHLHPAS